MANPLAPKAQAGSSSLGLLILRLALGVPLCMHGWPKVQHIADWMQTFGMTDPAPGYLQAMAAISEFGGGIAIAVGLLTPLAALGILCTMGYATYLHAVAWGHPLIADKGGPSYELPLVFLASALCILLCGPGKLSIDAVMFKRD